MMDTRNPLQPVHSRISLAREGPSFVLLLSHKRSCQILVLTASWDFIINNNSRKSPISRRILGIARCTFGVQLDANTRKCTSRPIANRQGTGIGDRTSLGAHSRRRPTSVVTTTCARARHAPLARRPPPAEDDDKFRDRTVMYSTVCGTTPKKRTTNSVTDSLP
jgi:hypothetical protein